MNFCTDSITRPSVSRSILLVAVLALPALGVFSQKRPDGAPYQKASLTTAKPCTVETGGGVTYLVRNGVELSVSEDWDCDRVADAYDNCVGMANPTQTDSDRNGIGDVCEAVSFIKAESPAKSRSNTKAKERTAETPPKAKPDPKTKTTTSKIPPNTRSNPKPRIRTAKAPDKRPRPGAKARRNS